MIFPPDSRLVDEVEPSPNHDERAAPRADLILLHYTGMRTAEKALERLCSRESKVSCHYFVFEDGRIVQLVPEARRAWHAGLSSWEGATDVNSRSIGIEIANPGHEFGYRDFPSKQVSAVSALSRDIAARHRIRADRVLAHSDVAPSRKDDPGEKFPWGQLATDGVGLWVEPAPVTPGPFLAVGDCGARVTELQMDLSAYGYGLWPNGNFDAGTQAVVKAFQRHFRPALVDGVADQSTQETLRRLLAAKKALMQSEA